MGQCSNYVISAVVDIVLEMCEGVWCWFLRYSCGRFYLLRTCWAQWVPDRFVECNSVLELSVCVLCCIFSCIFLKIKSSACSITFSNITCYCNLTFLLLVFIYICSFDWFISSRSVELMYLVNCFRFLFVSSLLLFGHFPTLSTLLFRIALSFLSLLHWNIRWSAVCVPCLHGHSGLPIVSKIKYFHGWS
jgi:hypothetical protein